ncbi:hypothetical protein [Methylomonas methanica]|nr:hypothetical protein [Methylomonas methanica]
MYINITLKGHWSQQNSSVYRPSELVDKQDKYGEMLQRDHDNER